MILIIISTKINIIAGLNPFEKNNNVLAGLFYPLENLGIWFWPNHVHKFKFLPLGINHFR